MITYIQSLIKKYWAFILYSLFGLLTTVANYIVYIPLYNYFHLSAVVSNGIAWVAAVLVAFLTNKPFVFKSKDWSAKVVVPELVKFLSCRIGSGVGETIILLVSVDIFQGNGNIWKIITSVLVIVFNYFGSKLFVFKNK